LSEACEPGGSTKTTGRADLDRLADPRRGSYCGDRGQAPTAPRRLTRGLPTSMTMRCATCWLKRAAAHSVCAPPAKTA